MTTTAARFGFARFVIGGHTIADLLAIVYMTKAGDSPNRRRRSGARIDTSPKAIQALPISVPIEPQLTAPQARRFLRRMLEVAPWFFGSHDSEVEPVGVAWFDRILTNEEITQLCKRF